MKVGVLGTGDVGQALGKGFVGCGHEVKMGARDPANEKARGWARQAGAKASAGTFADAARFGEIAVVATLGVAAESALEMAGLENMRGKVVIDATNPIDFDASIGSLKLTVGHTDSLGERIQRLLPQAQVVKAFNIVPHAHMFRPSFPGGPPDMLICGDNEAAKKKVEGVLEEFGWGVVDLGGIELARYLEPMAMAVVAYGMRTNTWNHALKLLRK